MKLGRLSLLISICSLGIVGCGDHDIRSAVERAELIQDVRLINYALKSAEWNIEVGFDSGSTESLQKKSQFRDEQSKDSIQRIFDEGRFLLVANDQRLKVAMNPEGKFKEVRDFSQNFSDGCKVQGGAVLQGRATHLDLELTWDWTANLVGSGCPQSAQSQFGEFVEAELARLNLKSASDLLIGLDQEVRSSRRVSMRLRLSGQINIDDIQVAKP